MTISFHYKQGTHQEQYSRLLLSGIDPVAVLHVNDRGPNVATWGWRRGQRYRDEGKNVLILERGYLGDRQEWTSLGWNGLNGYASFHNEDVPNDRWVKYWKDGMKPWRGDAGDYALVCGQVFTDMSLKDCSSYIDFLLNKFEDLHKRYGKVVYRPHPLADRRPNQLVVPSFVEVVDPTKSSAISDMEKARIVVAWNSNSLVEAMYNGIPFESNSPGSIVHRYMTNDLDTEPDRETWGRRISYCQWNKQELSDGTAWRHIKAGLVA